MQIIPNKDYLTEKLDRKKFLTVKLGIDPTFNTLTLGHLVVLNKFKTFIKDGHGCNLIIGDYTAAIGDPSGKSKKRDKLSQNQIDANCTALLAQIPEEIRENCNILYNSSWLRGLNLTEYASIFTLDQLLDRTDFSERKKNGSPIYLNELLYSICQGLDSLWLKADVEIGASDQYFNVMVGRKIMEHYGEEPQVGILEPILVGLDGKTKMSKTTGNFIALSETPDEVFGKVMSISDETMSQWISTFFPSGMKVESGNPFKIKLTLAENIVAMLHRQTNGEKERFLAKFSERDKRALALPLTITDEVRLINLPIFASANEGRRLIEQQAISINELKITDPTYFYIPRTGDLITVGRKTYEVLTK